MPTTVSRTRSSDISDARSTGDSFSTIRLPLESPPSDYAEAVRALRQRPTDELHRARKHHRRALKALREGAYDALPDATREQLIQRFQTNLTALNEALDKDAGEAPPETDSSSLLKKALTWLW